MAAKKYLALSFCLFLVILLFYTGINMAEQGSKDLLGVEEPLQAFRIYTREGGELEIVWSGRSRVFNFSFVTERAAHLWDGLRSFMESRRGGEFRGGVRMIKIIEINLTKSPVGGIFLDRN